MKRGVEQQQPPKSNFFFILMLTFMIVWTIQVIKAPKEDPVVPLDTSVTTNYATPKLSEEKRDALPTDFVQSAEREKQTIAPEFVTIGSLEEKSPYRMLATFTTRGAALARVELNDSHYLDHSDSTGYLGQIIVDESLAWTEFQLGMPGVRVQAVGKGTPAQIAGLKQNDRIVSIINAAGVATPVRKMTDLRDALLTTKPNDVVKIEVFSHERLQENQAYRDAQGRLGEFLSRPGASFAAGEVAPVNVSENSAIDANAENKELADNDANEASIEVNESDAADEQKQVAQDVSDSVNSEDEKYELQESIIAELGAPTTVEVKLASAPLSVLRPSGMVRDYADYLDLRGLQGATNGNVDGFYLLDSTKAEHIRKPNCDPLSFLTTLGEIDEEQLDWAVRPNENRRASMKSAPRSDALDVELGGVDMRNGLWELDRDQSNEQCVVFKKKLLERRLEVIKKYELALVDLDNANKGESEESKRGLVKNNRAYHLKLTFETRNYDPEQARSVAYLLDGPTGLPLEGAWFSSGRKTGPKMGAYGLRDVVVSLNDQKSFNVIKCWDVAQGKIRQSDNIKLDFLGIDGQYFQCTMLPMSEEHGNVYAYTPLRVGARVEEHMNFTDVSFRMKSQSFKLAPYGSDGDSVSEEFIIFAGPKQRDLVADYGLKKTLVYGWFWFVSIPLLYILHFFHDYLVFNYGLAILMLTVLVRLCLFPLSRKQVASSMRMQQLQPEIAKLKEKYKDNPQEMSMAQMALFKKYKVNPLSGCLPILIQMPIFIGLYRALSLDVNLYGAPLFSKSVRWCSNLAAPDMALDWSHFWNWVGWPSFNMGGKGFLSMFCLGPYLNILPIITICLFLLQQKLLVPPVIGDDEQARQQRATRRMMNFMMIFMGVMFFKVPSGLCVYFIVSSLWGLLERKMLPKRDLKLVPVADDEDVVAELNAKRRPTTPKRSNAKRRYTGYENRRDSKGRRITTPNAQEKPGGLRQWWNEVVERAKEQQRLAKAEEEDRSIISNRKRKNNKRKL